MEQKNGGICMKRLLSVFLAALLAALAAFASAEGLDILGTDAGEILSAPVERAVQDADTFVIGADETVEEADAPEARVMAEEDDFEIQGGRLCHYAGAGGDVVIPEGVTTIAEYVFKDCETLTSVHIPKGVTLIEERAFQGCRKLTAITIPEGVTEIGTNAFADTGLTTVTIPASVHTMGYNPFEYCFDLARIDVAEGNAAYESRDGVLIDKRVPVIISFPMAKGGDYTIPDGVEMLIQGTFEYCDNLTSVTIPASVTMLFGTVFCYNSRLTRVTILSKNIRFEGEAPIFESPAKDLTLYIVKGSNAIEWATNAGLNVKIIDGSEAGDGDSVKAVTLKGDIKKKVDTGTVFTIKADGKVKSYKSSMPEVAKVSSKGRVTAGFGGTARITVTLKSGKKRVLTLKVVDPDAPKKLSIVKPAATKLKVGGKLTLRTRITPKADRTKIRWTTSRSKVATVSSSGVVKGIRPGTATITATTSNGLKKSIRITIVKK